MNDSAWLCGCGVWNTYSDQWCYRCLHLKGDKADSEAVRKIIEQQRKQKEQKP